MGQRIAEGLRDAGYDVDVFTRSPDAQDSGQPLTGTRNEDGVTVHRMRTLPTGNRIGRLLGGVLFGIGLVAHCGRNRGRYDAITTMTVPPVMMGWCGLLAARVGGAKFVYHCMDLHPEAAAAVDLIDPSGKLYSALQRADLETVQRADAVVVLSEDMVATLAERGHRRENVSIINNLNPVSDGELPELPDSLMKSAESYRFLFAGNIGDFQGLDTVLEAFARLSSDDDSAELLFLGDGAAVDRLRRRCDELSLNDRVVFHPSVSAEVAASALNEADAAVVSLAPGVISAAYPSKTMACMAAGAPLLAIVERDSELSKMVVERDLGEVAEPGDVDGIAAAMSRLATRSGDNDRRAKIQEVGEELFGSERIVGLWSQLLSKLAGREVADLAPPIGGRTIEAPTPEVASIHVPTGVKT